MYFYILILSLSLTSSSFAQVFDHSKLIENIAEEGIADFNIEKYESFVDIDEEKDFLKVLYSNETCGESSVVEYIENIDHAVQEVGYIFDSWHAYELKFDFQAYLKTLNNDGKISLVITAHNGDQNDNEAPYCDSAIFKFYGIDGTVLVVYKRSN